MSNRPRRALQLVGASENRDEVVGEAPRKIRKFCTYFWIIFFIATLYIGVVITLVFAGIIWERDCPDCNCATPLVDDTSLTSSMVKEKLQTRDTGFTIFANNFIAEDPLRVCAIQCYNDFYVCPDKDDIEKCREHTSIPRSCSNFDTCVAECKSDCPRRRGLDDNICLNKFNYNLLCPA